VPPGPGTPGDDGSLSTGEIGEDGVVAVGDSIAAEEGVKGRNFEGDTPLHLAASSNGNRDMVAFLVECWPEGKEAKNDDVQTPLERLREYKRYSSAKPGPVELLLLC
jgi:hypothetical protein